MTSQTFGSCDSDVPTHDLHGRKEGHRHASALAPCCFYCASLLAVLVPVALTATAATSVMIMSDC